MHRLPGMKLERITILAGQVSLQVAARATLGKRVKQLRRKGIIPANLYGRHQPSQPLQVDLYTLDRFLAGHHATRVIDLHLDGGKGEVHNALMRHVSRSPRSGKILHVDFLRVSMTEPVTVRVPLTLKGTAPAVTVEGGVLLHLVDTLEIESLPGDIPEALELDISGLEKIDDTLHVRNVALPPRVTLLSAVDEPAVKVVAPRAVLAEEAAAAVEEAAAPAEAATPAAEAETSEESAE
jgi:large subunit ribosomal protein L25